MPAIGHGVSSHVLIWLACGGVFFVNGGCRHADGPPRIAVFGTVTSPSGDPINGMVSFLPEAGTTGPAATASLIDGTFEFDRGNGPVAGKYRVLVVKQSADRKHKGKALPAPEGPAPAAMSQVDRSATDEEWLFDAEVSLDNAEFDFEIPDPAAAMTSR
jgi:hypothetical protein